MFIVVLDGVFYRPGIDRNYNRGDTKMSEEEEKPRVFIKANKVLFIERYFSYDSERNKEKLNNKIKTRRL